MAKYNYILMMEDSDRILGEHPFIEPVNIGERVPVLASIGPSSTYVTPQVIQKIFTPEGKHTVLKLQLA